MVDEPFHPGLPLTEERAAIINERSRIARDIHDGAAQQFAHVLHKLELIQHILTDEMQSARRIARARAEVERARSILQAGLQDLRSSIAALLPAQLEGRDLGAALRDLLQEYTLDHPGLTISANLAALPPLPSALEIVVFRFIQEVLNNACKHGHATRITISIEHRSDALSLAVHDNGIGFEQQAIDAGRRWNEGAWHMGLGGMRERIEEAGGRWELESRPGAGTTVRACFPLLAATCATY